MLSAASFTKEELTNIVTQLQGLHDREDVLAEAVMKIFHTFDKDSNGVLDRKELRQFLHFFFEQYKVAFPLTDEYVDAVFVQIDKNRDNKVQPDELTSYSSHFIKELLPRYEALLAEKQ